MEMAEPQQQKLQEGFGAGSMTEGQQAASNPPVEDVWDEERLEKAMKTLKEMHIQVRVLI